jgi:hypothetical protein
MVGRGHTNKTEELLNINPIHLNTLFLWYDHDLPSKKVFKCIEFTFNKPMVSLV